MDEMKEKIDLIVHDGHDIDDLLKEIDAIDNEEERKEIIEYLVAAQKEAFLNIPWENEEILEKNIAEFIGKLSSLENISDETIEDILINQEFDAEMIFENSAAKEAEIAAEKKEIVKINEQIDELRKKVMDYSSAKELEEEIKTLETKKAEEMKSLDEQIASIEFELSKSDDEELQKLEEELKKLITERDVLSQGHAGSDEKIDEKIKKLDKEIKSIQEQIDREKGLSEKYDSISDDELDKKINKLLEYELKNGSSLSSEQLDKLRAEIDELENEKNKRNKTDRIKELEEKAKNLDKEEFYKKAKTMNLRNPLGDDYMEKVAEELYQKELKRIHDEIEAEKKKSNKRNSIDELEKKLNKLIANRDELISKKNNKKTDNISNEARKKELDKLIKDLEDKINTNTRTSTTNTLKESEDKLNKLKEERNNLWNDVVHHGEDASEEEKKRLEKLEKEIKELENKINMLKSLSGKSKDELHKLLEELKKKRKEIQSEYDGKIRDINNKLGDYKTLDYLTTVRNAYNQIRYQCELKYENHELEDDSLKTTINDFVDNHEFCKDLDKYPNADKLKNELKEELFNNLKSKKIAKTKDKKTWGKSIAAVAGFGVGFGLSMVPGVGTVRMVASTAKLANAVMHKLGVTKKINDAIRCHSTKHPDGIVSRIINVKDNFKEKHPEIHKFIKKAKEATKKYPINTFINGMAAGYITGNIAQAAYNVLKPDKIIPEVEAEEIVKPVEPVPPKPPVNPIEMINEIDAGDIELNPGDVVDISDIEYGLVSPDSTNYHHLLTSVGDDAVVDKFKVIGDKTMVHFKQSNGLGYAWFNLDDVKEVLAENAKEELMNKIAYEQLTNLDSSLENVAEATAKAVKGVSRR